MTDVTIEEIIVIDSDLRHINIPESLSTIGVAGDHKAEAIFFQIPRYFDGNDLSTHSSLIRYINAKNEYGEYHIDDDSREVDEDFIVFGWQITNDVTRYSGTIQFTVQFETVDVTNGTTYQWQTVPAQLKILSALPIESTITEKDDSLFRRISVQLRFLQNEVDKLKAQTTSREEIIDIEQRLKYLEDNVVYALSEF